MDTFIDILARIKSTEGIKKDIDIAKLFSISKGTLFKWKSRNTIILDKLIPYASSRNISLDWLLNGSGSIYKADYSLGSVNEPTVQYQSRRIHELESECARLRKVVKKIEDNISEISSGPVSDAGVAPDTP